MKKIVIIGYTGFIGKNLVNYLGDKYDIVAVSRSGGCSEEKNIKYVKSDYSRESLKKILFDVDGVVNLASQKAAKDESCGVQIYSSSLKTLENIILASMDCNIKNIVTISSRCVYGNYTKESFSENEEINPINKYGLMKALGEEICEYYNLKRDMKIKNIRLSQVIGYPMNDKYMFSTFLEKTNENETIEIYGQGTGVRDYIYIGDACRAVELALIQKDKSGIYNIGTGKGISNLEIAKKMIEVFKSTSKISVISDSPQDKSRIILNIDKAKKELGFLPEYDMDKVLAEVREKRYKE